MCRLLAYLGAEISFYELILSPQHSLEKQAWQPKELRETKLNADGFGFGWYLDINQPARYRQAIPIWNDANLQDISKSLQHKLCLAMVRSATDNLGIHHSNIQPFRYHQWLFQHNGYIQDFSKTARREIRQILHHEFENNIQGNTDSEYIFALFLHFLQQLKEPVIALIETINTIKEIINDNSALLNIMLSDGQQIIATKHAINGLCPTLYYGLSINDFPANSQLLVSEPLNDDSNWQAIEDNKLLVIQPHQPIEQFNL